MNDLVMLSVLCAIFVFFIMCFIIIESIKKYFNNKEITKISYISLIIIQIFCLNLIALSFYNIIDYLLI